MPERRCPEDLIVPTRGEWRSYDAPLPDALAGVVFFLLTVCAVTRATSSATSNGAVETAAMASFAPVIVRDPDRCGGEPTLAGTRIAVADVVSYANLYGGDLERVREDALPHLSMGQIRAAMEWYREYQEEIDHILRRRREHYERGLAGANAAR
jgi:uncharacterized protein (DUF433 family)